MVAQYSPERVAYCTVAADNPEMEAALRALPCPVLRVTGQTPAPVTVCYRTPETLGADRLAAVVGAVTVMPHTPLLVIDAGTCITYDLVDASGRYLGGNISAGVEMRLEALHARTARLPRVEVDGDVPDMGYDTETAIRAGVVRGIGFELQGFIRHWQKRYPDVRIFLTGGDRYAFSDALRRDILTDSHLVARGLNRLLGESL
jgi:type III pantothenate kinase